MAYLPTDIRYDLQIYMYITVVVLKDKFTIYFSDYESLSSSLKSLILGMCGMDCSSSVWFRFGFEKNCGFGFSFCSVLKNRRFSLVFFVDQL